MHSMHPAGTVLTREQDLWIDVLRSGLVVLIIFNCIVSPMLPYLYTRLSCISLYIPRTWSIKSIIISSPYVTLPFILTFLIFQDTLLYRNLCTYKVWQIFIDVPASASLGKVYHPLFGLCMDITDDIEALQLVYIRHIDLVVKWRYLNWSWRGRRDNVEGEKILETEYVAFVISMKIRAW